MKEHLLPAGMARRPDLQQALRNRSDINTQTVHIWNYFKNYSSWWDPKYPPKLFCTLDDFIIISRTALRMYSCCVISWCNEKKKNEERKNFIHLHGPKKSVIEESAISHIFQMSSIKAEHQRITWRDAGYKKYPTEMRSSIETVKLEERVRSPRKATQK